MIAPQHPHLELAGLSVRQVVATFGLERLRGQPIADGARVLYINQADLDAAIALWADAPDQAVRQHRFYGSEVPDDQLNCVWIYSNALVATPEQVAQSALDGEAMSRAAAARPRSQA